VPYLSASAVAIHYEEALYQVYAPLPFFPICVLIGILSSGDLDGRAFDAIRGLAVAEALAVLAELRQTNLEHVSNKSAFLCGLIKTHRQKNRMRNGDRNGESRVNTMKPDEAKIKVYLSLVLCSDIIHAQQCLTTY